MAFTIANLQPIGGNGRRGVAPMHFSYATLDAAATVDTTGYFNNASSILSVGDVIHRVTWSTAIGAGGTISTYGTHIVLSNAAGVVDVSDTTVGTVTDTD
jgi:hypothetical protein